MNVKDPGLAGASHSATERFNQNCSCITLDRAALGAALDHEAADTGFYEAFIKSRSHLFQCPGLLLQVRHSRDGRDRGCH